MIHTTTHGLSFKAPKATKQHGWKLMIEHVKPLEELDWTIDQSDEVALALALARDAELESGTVTALSHGELMTRLRG